MQVHLLSSTQGTLLSPPFKPSRYGLWALPSRTAAGAGRRLWPKRQDIKAGPWRECVGKSNFSETKVAFTPSRHIPDYGVAYLTSSNSGSS